MRIDPGFVRYPLRLENPSARVFFVNGISLLPGTLSADLRADVIHVHVLDLRSDTLTGLRRLEHRVADLFHERLEAVDA
jgi:multicomponent Na+:H+ antiporter subunit E